MNRRKTGAEGFGRVAETFFYCSESFVCSAMSWKGQVSKGPVKTAMDRREMGDHPMPSRQLRLA